MVILPRRIRLDLFTGQSARRNSEINILNNYLMVYLLVSKELIRKKDDSLFKINHNTL